MNQSTCDACGRELLVDSEVRYEVKIEVKAAYDPLEISAEDLAKDHKAELAKLIRQLEELSAEEAMNQVYRAFNFDLCPVCQQRYIRNLAAGNLLPCSIRPHHRTRRTALSLAACIMGFSHPSDLRATCCPPALRPARIRIGRLLSHRHRTAQ